MHKFTSSQISSNVWERERRTNQKSKFTKRWNEYLERYREAARIMDGENNNFVFHIFLGKKTIVRSGVRSMSGFKQLKEKIDIILLQNLRYQISRNLSSPLLFRKMSVLICLVLLVAVFSCASIVLGVNVNFFTMSLHVKLCQRFSFWCSFSEHHTALDSMSCSGLFCSFLEDSSFHWLRTYRRCFFSYCKIF